LPDLNISDTNVYEKKYLYWDNIISDQKNFIWTYDASKACIKKPGAAYDPYRRYTYAYYIKSEESKRIDSLEQITILQTPKIEQNNPYSYLPIVPIFGININLFNNWFSKKMYEHFIDKLMLKWMKTRYNVPTKSESINRLITYYVNTGIKQPGIRYLNPIKMGINGALLVPSLVKIHICVKLEYLFWTIEKLLTNLDLFICIDERGGTDLPFDALKILDEFINYTYFEEFISDFPALKYVGQSLSDKFTYKHKINNKEYDMRMETVNEANIVIYPAIYAAKSELNRNNVRKIVETLLVLFPNELNISSKKYPRFNFRINDNIYIGFGNGDHKEKILDPVYNNLFDQPIEYDEIKCENIQQDEKCSDKNVMSKFASNHELCVVTDDKCVTNNILSKYKLVFKKTPAELVVDGQELNSVQNIYNFIFLPIPHN